MDDDGKTRPDATVTRLPRENVLETTELMEKILSYLPLRELLVCRDLSKRVKRIIDDSPLLKETMFLRPTRAQRQAWRLPAEIDGSGKGITSVRPVSGMVPLPGGIDHLSPRYPMPHETRTPAVLNPIFPDRLSRTLDGLYSRDMCDHVFTADILHHIESAGDLTRPGSVLDMYLTQPPCRQAWVTASFSVPSNPTEVSHLSCEGLLELETGITIRDLHNAASTVRGVVHVTRLAPKPPKRKKKRGTYTNWEPRKYKKPEPKGFLPSEIFPNATLVEILKSLDILDEASANNLQTDAECWLSDTIVASDEMWAGVAPYMEDATQ